MKLIKVLRMNADHHLQGSVFFTCGSYLDVNKLHRYAVSLITTKVACCL